MEATQTSQSRNWFATLNNPTVDPEEYLRSLHEMSDAVFTCGQLERGDNGTPHI